MKKTEGRIFLVADTHLGHNKMIEYCGRPKNHSELILKNLNALKFGDTLIHLGDVCMGRDEFWNNELLSTLPGIRKILVKGNHDDKSTNWYMIRGWDFVCESFKMKIDGKLIEFSHEPIIGTKCLNVHGHLHNIEKIESVKGYNKDLNKLVSIEINKYKPVLINQIIGTKRKS